MMTRIVLLGTIVLVCVKIAGPHGALGAQGGPPAGTAELEARELGRLLFWDPILSGPKDTACATCHHPDFAYADGRDLSLGTGAVGLGPARTALPDSRIPVVKRNSPTILNVVFNGADGRRRGRRFDGTPASVDQGSAPMFWDNRVRSLETQALEPLKALEEMRGTTYPEDRAVDAVVTRLREIPEYAALFEKAFGSGAEVNASNLARAIAAFERAIAGMNSPFDRYRAGETDALTPQQRRGLATFDRVGCDRCHEGPLFSDFDLHAEGVREHPQLADADDGGGRFRFRTPSLRNVAVTAPYMHNGVLATLPDVLRFYDRGESENPNVSNETGRQRGSQTARLSRNFRRVDDMSDAEMRDIIAFLEALTDSSYDKTIPARVPSGLPPGGLLRQSAAARR
jgi:cytochrome c peroxidase